MGCPLSKNGSESDSGGGGNTATTAGTAGNSSAGGGGGAGKSESGNKNGEGGGGGASAKPADPRLPLNVRQKFNLSKSWKGISREMEMTGVLMFVK